MPILTQDIQLLKAAVQADTTDGGGPMTGVQVVDGVSNNLLPDTSAMDRAFGRVQLRKLFGVAHSLDTDTLLGAHAIITKPPADPLVACSLFRTSGWFDTRDAAKNTIERYLAKGPKAAVRIYGTHYAGSQQLQLVDLFGVTHPVAGDCLVLVNPVSAGSTEQFVRIVNLTKRKETLALSDGNKIVLVAATVITCDLGQLLTMDVMGPQPSLDSIGSDVAHAYTTTLASGARFYSIKPLGANAAIGDMGITTAGGVYTNLVPAATVENPVIDQTPLNLHPVVVDTGYADVVLNKSMPVTANSVVYAPCAIAVGSVRLSIGATQLTDANGVLLQGTTDVGTVDYANGVLRLASTAPNYGTQTVTLRIRPGAAIGAHGYSLGLKITTANQGLAFVGSYHPLPAPGAFTLSYMAQGRWYELQTDLAGKLSGADPAYGVGTLNHSTGSLAVTLGAIPDVDSYLISSWGNATGFDATPLADLPDRLYTLITLTQQVHVLAGTTFTWTRGANNYTATADAYGALSGDAQGGFYDYAHCNFVPNVLPDGAITVALTPSSALSNLAAFVATGSDVELSAAVGAVQTGSVRGVAHALVDGFGFDIAFYDRGGNIYTRTPKINRGAETVIGTINYATRMVSMPLVTVGTERRIASFVTISGISGGNIGAAPQQEAITYATHNVDFVFDHIVSVAYADAGAVAAATQQVITNPIWLLEVNPGGGSVVPDSVAFTLNGALYTAKSGTLRIGFDVMSGAAPTSSAGAVSSDGMIAIASLPSGGAGSNSVTWLNFARDQSANGVTGGIFRTLSAPLKSGVFNIGAGALAGGVAPNSDLNGDFFGRVDFERGIVQWGTATAISPATLSYNAVALTYLPLDANLLGLDTARLPLDGKIPIFKNGDLCVVHNTQIFAVPNPVTKGIAYDLGRVRIASVRVSDSAGAVLPESLYTTDLDAGTITFTTGTNTTAYPQPWEVAHRIEDMVLCSQVDISGKLKFTRSLTHAFPADTSYVSNAIPFGDLFARAYNAFEQQTWTAVWADERLGSPILANFNDGQFPIAVTNKGAIKERWALIFTNTTAYRVIGEHVGEIAVGNTSAPCAPINPATGEAYFSVDPLGFGAGWSAGNVLRFNTDACGAALWVARTVLQGPASLQSDSFQIAFRGDVDRP